MKLLTGFLLGAATLLVLVGRRRERPVVFVEPYGGEPEFV